MAIVCWRGHYHARTMREFLTRRPPAPRLAQPTSERGRVPVLEIEPKAAKALDTVSLGILSELTPQLQTATWTRDTLEGVVTALAESHGLGLGKVAGPLRAALAGRTATPSVFDMMTVLGREETLARLSDAIDAGPPEAGPN